MSDDRTAWVTYCYRELGWSFVRLNGKQPLDAGWQARTRETLEEAVEWAANGNVGLRTGHNSGVIVLDVDGATAEDNLRQFPPLPETVEVQSRPGRRHIYLAIPDDVSIRNRDLAPKINVRADGGQVVFPGSVHPDTGDVYEWVNPPDVTPVATAPGWLIDRLTSRDKPTRTAVPTTEPVQNPAYVKRALQREVWAIKNAEEGTRNNTLNTAAFNLGQLVGGGAVDRGRVEVELAAAVEIAGWDYDIEGRMQTEATIRSGIDSGMLHPRTPPPPKTATPPTPNASPAPPDEPDEPDKPDEPVLIPGPHVNADGVYQEISTLDFANTVLDRLPDGALYRKGHIPGEIAGPCGKQKFVELSSDAGRLMIDGHMRLGAWYQNKNKKKDDDGPEHVLVFKPASRDHSSLFIAAARVSDKVRELDLLVSYPAYGPGWERLRRGWSNGIYYDEPEELANIEPTLEIEEIRGVLEELIVDFPFKDEASRQNFFGLLLTPIIAPAIEGNRPMHLILAPLERTGKSKLAEEIFGGVILGRPTPALQIAGHEEERDKRILALLMLGESLIHLDNLPQNVNSATLASLLTATTYQGRILGASRVASLPNTLTVVGSGNNTECSGEIAKRSVPILLEPRTAHPELRSDFHHSDLRAHVRSRRRDILAALLGMVETWRANGMPRGRKRMGGFEAWSEAIGGIMKACGFTQWRDNAHSWATQADPDGEELAAFVAAWADHHATRYVTATDLVRVAEEAEVYTDQLERKTQRGKTTTMGTILRRIVNRPTAGWVVRRAPTAKRPTQYFLEVGRSDVE